jgi:dihydrodipicolinate synthase/N-acetylneuraminate lyase
MIPTNQLATVLRRLTTRRAIDGVAAVFLPLDERGRPQLDKFARMVQDTYAAGLTPAINTEIGSVNLLTPDERQDVLAVAAGVALGRRFLAGAFIDDRQGDLVDLYRRDIASIVRQGGIPLLFQAVQLTALDEDAIVDIYREATAECEGVLAREQGRYAASAARVYSLDLFQRLMDIPTLSGLHHASFDRVREWYRLEARDVRRPDFRIYSGNDLAIDMAFYGSDYLLGSASLSLEGFRLRDTLWRAGDARVIVLNDLLQQLAWIVFRPPTAAFRHSAAQYLHLRGIIDAPIVHPSVPRRPESDVDMLREVSEQLEAWLEAFTGTGSLETPVARTG